MVNLEVGVMIMLFVIWKDLVLIFFNCFINMMIVGKLYVYYIIKEVVDY